LLLRDKAAVQNPFFHMAPNWAKYPLVILATVAAVIASQAVISGAFSLTRQAVQLGYVPRIQIRHTSAREIGQIYIPSVNWVLMVAAIGLVLAFKESSALAIGALVFTAMTTWARGRQVLAERLKETTLSTDDLLRDLAGGRIPRVPGTAIFLSRQADGVPTTLLHNLKHNKVVHQRVILL